MMARVVADVTRPARVAVNPDRSPTARSGGRWRLLLWTNEGSGVGRAVSTRALIFDCVVAALFFACGSVFLPLFMPQAIWIDEVFVGLVTMPLMLRRRLPRTSFALILVFATVQSWALRPIGMHDAGFLFGLYSVVGFTNRRTGIVAALLALVPTFSGALNDWWNFIDISLVKHPGLFTRVCTTTGMVVLVALAWFSGEGLRSSRLLQDALVDRTVRLEREREQQARLAASAERARIAREMHDVIAHALSVMIAQADGGAYVIDQDAAEAKAALERISTTGRDSLTQMRGLLGLLRSGEGDDDQPSAPQPGLAELPLLIEDAGRTGLKITVRRRGSERPIAEMLGLTVYRLIQESLTNARKHGGDHVEIDMETTAQGVDLRVTNDFPAEGKQLQTGAEPGHGLNGMGERVTAVGGRFTAEPTRDGFLVHAWLPHTGDGDGGR
ncbi:two-component sensor histidine kinase [Microlunatus endophyticus]|uniref:histidine kinase n=1 Tax=Microlunatus endophyticus TaxID=1716077 RepID=A0A917S7G0_9ACTN|nr:two-component sensor histidine kinase [Microlunatus endophyticus]